MTEVDQQIVTLSLFNEKVRELLESSFVEGIFGPNVGFALKLSRDVNGKYEMNSTIRGPSIESVKAFVLTLRFFIQDNESISLRNMADLYNSNNIDPQLRAYFHSARDEVKQMLGSPNLCNMYFHRTMPTNRQVMEVFVYGALAHANPEKYDLYKEWTSYPAAGVILQTCFNVILGRIFHALAYIEQVNEQTLQQLTTLND